MIKLLTSKWTAAFLGAVVYLACTVIFWKAPVVPRADASQEQSAAGSRNGPSWEFSNPEADQLIAELKAEKESLNKRKQQLDEFAVRLEAERTEVNQATQSVHQLQLDFDKNVVRVTEEETANLKKLAKVYSEMSPDSAAKIFTEMEDHSVIKIMVFMKDGDTAAIFESMAKNGVAEAKRVAALSESLRLSIFRNNTPK